MQVPEPKFVLHMRRDAIRNHQHALKIQPTHRTSSQSFQSTSHDTGTLALAWIRSLPCMGMCAPHPETHLNINIRTPETCKALTRWWHLPFRKNEQMRSFKGLAVFARSQATIG
jgi:hypothetical protein